MPDISTETLVHWLGGLLVGVIAYFLRSLHVRVEKHLEGASHMEAEVAVLKAQQDSLEAWLKRVEGKLDRVLEKRTV